jgi:hypothetical protein
MITFLVAKKKVANHEVTKMYWDERKELKRKLENGGGRGGGVGGGGRGGGGGGGGGKLTFNIIVIHYLEGEKSPPKTDGQPTQDGQEINNNECIYELKM